MPDQDNSTLNIAEPAEDCTPTAIQTSPETDPTKIASKSSSVDSDDISGEHDQDDLRPSLLRYILVISLFAFSSVWLVVNNYNLLSQTSSLPEWNADWTGERYVITWVNPNFTKDVLAGDEIESVKGEKVDERYKFRQFFRKLDAGETYPIQVIRGKRIIEVSLTARPVPFGATLNAIFVGILTPAVFFLTGLFVFLFKPNNKLTILIGIAFSLLSAGVSPTYVVSYAESLPLAIIWQIGNYLALWYAPVLLHFFLIFPVAFLVVDRFPKIQALIYVPFLVYVVPVEIGQTLAFNGFAAFEIFLNWDVLNHVDFLYSPYLVLTLLVFFFSYRNSDEQEKRRLRVFLVGVALAVFPILLFDLVLYPLEQALDFRLFATDDWKMLATNLPPALAPPIFAYAVIRHRVIPISFIIRRGLQYLFAKNALRVLVLVPIAAIVWNVASDPDRTLGDLFLKNSTPFYSAVVLAIGFGLLSRYRLSEWIDRRFFREQYDQELLFRGLIENIKASDSMIKLSRLVSSQIQAAMHPSCIHFFYETQRNSDFSVGYTTAENSGNMRLAVDSPLLRFMEKKNATVRFPSLETDELPPTEKAWLREIGAHLLVPMHGTDRKLVGFFSLGEKLSEIRYSERDKDILETLANQIAIVHENLSLKDRMFKEQIIRNEVLSRFDEGNINLLKECPRCGRCFDRSAEFCPDDAAGLTFSLPVERTIENRYRLERLIGKGGMGAVYEATDLRINRQVAVKILSGAKFGNREALRRFEREAQTAGKLNHRNIVTIFDYGVLTTEGAFLVMELVRGEGLREILAREGKLETETVVSWFGQVLDGLDAAHKAGIIHRDLKPDNILRTQNESGATRLCILDFGLAREQKVVENVTVPGTIMGTFGYMPPEQLRGESADERSDLYSVGVVIYEALEGIRPFREDSYHALLGEMSKINELRTEFSGFFSQALAFERAERFESAALMKLALAALRSE